MTQEERTQLDTYARRLVRTGLPQVEYNSFARMCAESGVDLQALIDNQLDLFEAHMERES